MSPDPRVEVRPETLSGPDLGMLLTRAARARWAGPAGRVGRAMLRRTGRRRLDRGSLSLEMAILFPLVLILTFGPVQVGLWFEARSMCQAAAEAGVRAGKVLHAPSGAGAAAARSYLSDVANGLVVSPNVTETRTPATVSITCAGQAQNVIPFPGLNPAVRQSSQAGIERFTR